MGNERHGSREFDLMWFDSNSLEKKRRKERIGKTHSSRYVWPDVHGCKASEGMILSGG